MNSAVKTPSKTNRCLVALGLASVAIGLGYYDWRVSAIIMGIVITLAGLEKI